MIDDVMRRVRDLFQGATTANGSVSLATGSATTTTVDLSDRRIGSADSHVTLTPTNAAAATEVGAGGLYIVASRGQFVIHHSASAGARTFTYEVRTGYGQ
jgi:hypothetical protein